MKNDSAKTETIEGDPVYDEKSEARLYNINNRLLCIRHKWINASLNAWPDQSGSHDIGHGGYGAVRFCRRCKIISCVHYFTYKEYLHDRKGKYFHTKTLVGHCSICNLQIKLVTFACYSSSDKAVDLIRDIVGADRYMNLPSGYHCKMPLAVSEMLDNGKEDEAKHYIESCLSYGVPH